MLRKKWWLNSTLMSTENMQRTSEVYHSWTDLVIYKAEYFFNVNGGSAVHLL